METLKKSEGRIVPALLVFLTLLVAFGAALLAPIARAQDPGISNPAQWANASVTAPAASQLLAGTATQRYVIKAIYITDSVAEPISLLDGATTIFKLQAAANTPIPLGSDFFGPTGYTPAAVNTAFKVTAATGIVTVSVRYLLQ